MNSAQKLINIVIKKKNKKTIVNYIYIIDVLLTFHVETPIQEKQRDENQLSVVHFCMKRCAVNFQRLMPTRVL